MCTHKHRKIQMNTLKIRFDEDEAKYLVYFLNAFGHCAYQSKGFDTLAAAEAFRLTQIESADLGDEE